MSEQPDPLAIVGATLACDYCGETVRIAADLSGDLNRAANAWWDQHRAPELVAVETESGGVVDEWVAV